MIRRHATRLRLMLALADAAVAVVVVGVVHSFRYGIVQEPIGWEALQSLWAPILLYAVIWVLLLYLVGEYRLRARWTLRSEAAGIAKATIWLALLSLSLLFLTDLTEVSRVFLIVLFPVQGAVTFASRAALRWLFMTLRRRGRNSRNLLILGTGPQAYRFAQQVEAHTAFGVRVMGFLGDPPAAAGGPWPYLGPVGSALEILHRNVVDEVAICLPRNDWALVEEIVGYCQDEGKIVRIPLDAPQIESGLRFVEDLDGTAVLSLLQGPDHVLSLALKRFLDVLGAATALVLLSPLILGVGVYILVRDGRPILFRQTRVGMQGRPFTIVKFRTMVRDAEERFPDVAGLTMTRGAAFKMEADPRITSWGRFLRRTSIDELPQFWNVLTGQMSLVGPRPAPPREVDQYNVWHRRRLSMKPGMTGLWQVSRRIDRDFDDRARLDLDYIDRWSLWLDLRIVAKTFSTVLHAEGR